MNCKRKYEIFKRYQGHRGGYGEEGAGKHGSRAFQAFLRRPGAVAAALCLCLLLGFFLGSLRVRARSEGAAVVARAPAEEVTRSANILVDINTADEELPQTLPGIGPALAERIVAYREASGGFRYLYELTNVKGIGSRTFEGLQDLITISTEG